MQVGTTSDPGAGLIRACVHADSGAGKTTSLRTLPEQSTVIVNAERNTLPLQSKTFPLVEVRDWQDLKQVCAAAQDLPTFFDSLNGKPPQRFVAVENIVFDSLSAISEMAKQHILNIERPALVRERTKNRAEAPTGIYGSAFSMEDWGQLRNKMLAFFDVICRLQCDVFCTCLSQWTEDPRTKRILKTPNLSGKLAQECAAYFDLMLFMGNVELEDGTQKRMWRTANDGVVLAKDASGRLDELEEPNWTAVVQKIRNC